jgi:hypothetical protein
VEKIEKHLKLNNRFNKSTFLVTLEGGKNKVEAKMGRMAIQPSSKEKDSMEEGIFLANTSLVP